MDAQHQHVFHCRTILQQHRKQATAHKVTLAEAAGGLTVPISNVRYPSLREAPTLFYTMLPPA